MSREPDQEQDGVVSTEIELDALYDAPHRASIDKEVSALTEPYRRMIESSPFAILCSVGSKGADATPRGDAPGFVRVLDERTLALPDRRGNNRLDSLRNIIHDPRVALLFLIPGCNESLRVSGRGTISRDAGLLESFSVNGRVPTTVLLIGIERVYFQCGRALMRSGLWRMEQRLERQRLPTAGEMIRAADNEFDADAYDRDLPQRQGKTLY